MSRRLPTPLPLVLAATVGLFALTTALTAQPATQPAAATPANPGDGIKRTQEENLKLYKRFADELLKLAQKWEKSDNLDERERAKSLRAALTIADKQGVETLFRGVVNGIAGAKTGPEFEALLAKDTALTKALEQILETLETEGEADKIKRDINELKDLIKAVADLKRRQETLLARTNAPKADPNKLSKDQGDLAKETKDLAGKLDKTDPKDGKTDPKGGNPDGKDDKSEPKPEAKPGESSAEPKTDAKDPKSDGKDPMGGDPKAGEPKGGEPKGDKKPDAGSSKETPKDGMGGDPKDPKAGGEPKPMGGEPKVPKGPMPPNGGDPKEPKGGDPKPMSPSDSKAQGDGKGDSKPSPPMGGDSKPMSPSGGMPMDSPPSSGSPKPGGSPSDSPPSGPKPPNPNNPNDEAKRNVEEAVPPQQDAEKKLKENNREEATKKEDDAIKALDKALKELEKRLKQLREKEMLKKLEDLERRVAKMLKMQIEVYEATKTIDGAIKKNNNQKTTAEIQKSGVEGEKEAEIAVEAEKALRLLEGEGTAVVFAAVLEEARKDMEAVQKQLQAANVGPDTQLVEEQIIAQLQRMLEALKKAKQDLENPPPPPPPGMPPPPGEQKKNLIQLVEQLKLLKDLQLQVNQRTTAFGKRTPGQQAADPFLQEQLKQLGDRQKTLQGMLHKIADQLNQP